LAVHWWRPWRSAYRGDLGCGVRLFQEPVEGTPVKVAPVQYHAVDPRVFRITTSEPAGQGGAGGDALNMGGGTDLQPEVNGDSLVEPLLIREWLIEAQAGM
jgi:hypothetical protein